MAKNFIQNAIKKPGSLRKQLGVKKGKKIKKSLLNEIMKDKVGKKVRSGKKSVRVTPKLKKRANLAKTLRSFKK